MTHTNWHNIVVWDPKLMDTIQRYCTTGKQVMVEGESTTRSYQDRNGNTQYIREIKASKVVPIQQIEDQATTLDNVNKAFVIGTLVEKPTLDTNEQGESTCTLHFKAQQGTLPIQLTGPKAEIAARYLDAGRVAHVSYQVISTDPFQAIGIDLVLLGQRPTNPDNTSYAKQDTHPAPKAAHTPPQQQADDNGFDDLPF